MKINIIAAISNNNIISVNDKIPWSYPEDMKYFKNTVNYNEYDESNNIIVGYNTYKDIKQLFKLHNIYVIDKSVNDIIHIKDYYCKNLYYCNNIDIVINNISNISNAASINWCIGGESLYNLFLLDNNYTKYVDKLYLTLINENIQTVGALKIKYFPNIPAKFSYTSITKGENILFTILQNNDNYIHEEYQYLNQISNIITNGIHCDDRTGVGITSLFGCQMRYKLDTHFPLLTTKKVFIRGIIEELLWFLRGETNAKILYDKNVHIWDANTTQEYIDNHNLKYNEFDGGPIYGHSFRHYGAPYIDCNTDYSGQGVDQLSEVIRLIRDEPDSRRIIINLWNPCVLDEVVLPPCHMVYQFRVYKQSLRELCPYKNKLSCSMYQRSGDMGLGVPFNIASAALMTYIIAFLTNTVPYELIHTIGDSHVYNNHIDALNEQITREPMPFPVLNIINRGQQKVEDFNASDFEILGYKAHPAIKMDMAI